MRLRPYLDREKITATAFAATIGVTPTALYRYLDGSRMPRRETIERIFAATGGEVRADDFHSYSAPPPQDVP